MNLNPIENFIDKIFSLPYMPSKGAVIFLIAMIMYRFIPFLYNRIKSYKNNNHHNKNNKLDKENHKD